MPMESLTMEILVLHFKGNKSTEAVLIEFVLKRAVGFNSSSILKKINRIISL